MIVTLDWLWLPTNDTCSDARLYIRVGELQTSERVCLSFLSLHVILVSLGLTGLCWALSGASRRVALIVWCPAQRCHHLDIYQVF